MEERKYHQLVAWFWEESKRMENYKDMAKTRMMTKTSMMDVPRRSQKR